MHVHYCVVSCVWCWSLAAACAAGCAAPAGHDVSARLIERGTHQSTTGSGGAARRTAIARIRASCAPSCVRADDPCRRSKQRSGAGAALLALAALPRPPNHSRWRAEYRELGVTDDAYEHYPSGAAASSRATRRRTRAGAHLARLGLSATWRWRDAYRAVYYAPESAAAHNTLGTLLQALGQRGRRTGSVRDARCSIRAAFALNNLCYLALRQGNGTRRGGSASGRCSPSRHARRAQQPGAGLRGRAIVAARRTQLSRAADRATAQLQRRHRASGRRAVWRCAARRSSARVRSRPSFAAGVDAREAQRWRTPTREQ